MREKEEAKQKYVKEGVDMEIKLIRKFIENEIGIFGYSRMVPKRIIERFAYKIKVHGLEYDIKEKEKWEEEASPTIDTDERVLDAVMNKFATEFNKKYEFDKDENKVYEIKFNEHDFDERNERSKEKEMKKAEEAKMNRITEIARMTIKKFEDKDDMEQENPSEMEIRNKRKSLHMDY